MRCHGILLVACSLLQGVGHARADSAKVSRETGAQPQAVGVSATLGQPASLRLHYRLPNIALSVDAGLGMLVADGSGLQMDLNLRWEPQLGPVRLQLGVGMRRLEHDYRPASIDELGSDTHDGVHGILGASWRLSSLPLDLIAEIVPGYDLAQTESCTFGSGTQTLCPHQSESRRYLNMGIGARYWIEL